MKITFIEIIEYVSVTMAIVSVACDIKRYIAARFFALLSSIFSLYVFYMHMLYGRCLLAATMMFMQIYGICIWKWGTQIQRNQVITRLKKQELAYFLIIGSISAYALSLFLAHIGQINFYNIDAVNTVFSIVANWLLVNKKLENWMIWFFLSIIYFFVVLKQQLYGFALLQVGYVILDSWGYYTWRKSYKKQ